MKTRACLLLALLVPATARTAAASPVPSIAYQNCWTDSWDYDLWCDVWATAADGSGHLLVDNGVEPAWSPDGSKVAFGRFNPAGGLAVLDVVTGALTDITTGIGRGPAWSPDGTKLVFRDGLGAGDLVVANADGSERVQLTATGDVKGRPTWSQDGSRIAYGCLGASGNRGICAMNPDGTGIVQLTDDAAPDYDPAFSPDGSSIAFTTEGPSYQIAVMTSQGADAHLMGIPGYAPAWSPDGAAIAFSLPYVGACPADGSLCYDLLHTINTDLTGEVQIGGGTHPSWTASAQMTRPIARFSQYCDVGRCTFYGDSWDLNGTLVSEAWDYGDGATGSGSLVAHSYSASGTYDVTLTVMDDDGLTAALVHTVSVVVTHPPFPPGALFTFACTQRQCTFNGLGSYDPEGYVVGYAWTFGDGATGSGATPSHTYAAAGTFTVSLTVTDDDGLHGSVTHAVTVTMPVPPVAAFTVACTQNQCAFNGQGSSDPDGTIAGYAWTYGDGATASGATASHTYAAAGTYTALLTVTDNDGLQGNVSHSLTVTMPAPPVAAFTVACTQNQCAFNGQGSSDPDGTIAGYAWTFGDGAAAAGSTAAHTYAAGGTFTATLTVTDDQGLQGAVSHPVIVTMPAPPVAAFTVTCTETVCAFNGSGSSDPDGTVVGYAWTYGDGATGSGATASHTYAAAGTYAVSLRVTDNQGLQGTVSHSATATTPRSHVGDLDGTVSGSGSWTARVTAVVHTSAEARLANATVTGTWSLGGSSSCTTNAVGECAVSKASIPNRTHSVTFTVTGVTHATRAYNAGANHDPDGDSTGTVITVSR